MDLFIKKHNNAHSDFKLTEIIVVITICIAALCGLGLKNYDFFHRIVEQAGVILGCCVFLIALHTYKLIPDAQYNYMGMTYGFIALFEFLHSFYLPTIDLSLQLNLSSRLFQCLPVLIFLPFVRERLNFKRLFYIYIILSILLLSSIYWLNIFPKCYDLHGNHTPFFIIGYSFTMLILIAGCILLYRSYRKNKSNIKKQILIYASLIISYQIIILFNRVDYYIPLIIAHVVKFLSYFPMYMIVTKHTFSEPVNTMFTDLHIKNDELTKKEELLNKQNLELVLKNKALIKANSKILSSEKKYKKLIEFLPNAVMVVKGTKIVFMNKQFNDIFGEEMPDNKSSWDILKLPPGVFRHLLEKDLNYVYQGNNIQSVQTSLEIKNKTTDVEYSILYYTIDNAKHALFIFEDITEKKQLQDILNKAKVEEENEKMKIEFLANISHELRTPINLIYSALQLEDIYMANGNMESIEKYNKVIKQNCFRLLRIINNLIDATKIDASHFKAKMRIMDIVSLIEESTLSVVPFIESKNISVTFDTDVEEKYVICDPDLIERVILNLLANSVKYGVDGGSISVTLKDRDESVEICIEDDGIGIPKDKREMLFQRFVQVDKSFSRNTEGSGIGLYLVKCFVEMHAGTISLESEEGSGSKFKITFPCSAGLDECAATLEGSNAEYTNSTNIIEKVNIEFADIYMN